MFGQSNILQTMNVDILKSNAVELTENLDGVLLYVYVGISVLSCPVRSNVSFTSFSQDVLNNLSNSGHTKDPETFWGIFFRRPAGNGAVTRPCLDRSSCLGIF